MKQNNIQVTESRKKLRNSGFRYKLTLGTDSKDYGQLGKMYQSASWEFDSTGNLSLMSISLFKSSNESQKLFNLLFNTLTNSQYDWNSDYQVLASNTVQNQQLPFESLSDVSKNISYMTEDDVLTVIIR
jgi:hypothetical protein